MVHAVPMRSPKDQLRTSPFTCHRKDYYQVLGVDRNATQRQIKLAYYQLSKKYHPDVAGRNAGTESKFIEISEAYDCLKDPEKRRIYDGNYGRGGRYTGDPYDFKDFRQYGSRRRDNPFYNRQYTEEEYQRIWEQFNRMRSERQAYDEQIRQAGEKLWEQFARERATRWQQFHARYPTGPPGSFRYEWRWTSTDPSSKRGVYILSRVIFVYTICFFVVAIIQILSQPFVSNPRVIVTNGREEDDRKSFTEQRPSVDFSFMNQAPAPFGDSWTDVVDSSYPKNESETSLVKID